VGKTRKLPRVPSWLPWRWRSCLPGVPTRDNLVQRDAQGIEIAVAEFSFCRQARQIDVWRKVSTRSTTVAQLVFPSNGTVEVDNLRALVCPQQIARFDITMIDAVAVQVHKAVRDFTRQLKAICRGEDLALDHFTDVESIKKFKHEEWWAITRQKVSVEDLHYM